MTLVPDAFERVRRLVHVRTAIVLEPGKEYLVETRLASIARSHGFEDVNALCLQLDRSSHKLTAEVVEAMTTNETTFFRDHHPFEALRHAIIPKLIAGRARTRSLRIWCAACSTGQEPYSVAMLLADHFPALASWNVVIEASDVCKTVLERAQSGRYRQVEVGRGLHQRELEHHFVRLGLEWQISGALQSSVHFRQLNLVGPWPSSVPFDLVLLRNVLIYFDQETKHRVLDKVRRRLAEDGFLMLGGSETPPPPVCAFERLPIARAGLYRAIPRTKCMREKLP